VVSFFLDNPRSHAARVARSNETGQSASRRERRLRIVERESSHARRTSRLRTEHLFHMFVRRGNEGVLVRLQGGARGRRCTLLIFSGFVARGSACTRQQLR
jgi:hypothetical protein